MKKYVTLGEICKLTMGQSPDSSTYNRNGEGVPFYQGNADFGELHPITTHWCTEPTKFAENGDILISVRAPIGALNIAIEHCCIGRGLAAITIDNYAVSRDYIWYMLKSKVTLLQSLGTGSTFKAINKNILNDMRFQLPSIDEQKKIAIRLRKIDKVIQNCIEMTDKLDLIIKSQFVEMFGVLERTTTISRYISELRGGKSLAGTDPCKNKVLKTGAATFGWFDPEQYKYLPTDYEPLPEHKVETGDVIISRMNTPELVGACSYVFEAPEDMYYPDRLWKVVLKENTNPIFLWQLLWDRDVRKAIKDSSGGTSGTMHNISKTNLLAIKCMDVPIELQNEYAEFIKQIDKSKYVVYNLIKNIRRVKFYDQF